MKLNLKSISRYFPSLNMVGNVNAVEQTPDGNTFYFKDLMKSKGVKVRTNYDMMDVKDKELALLSCIPLSSAVNKCGSLFSNGKFYVYDNDGNESDSFNDIRELLHHPNPIQSERQFAKHVEITFKTFGFCPIYTLRATPNSLPSTMWVIPPPMFHAVSTGNMFKQNDISGIIKNAYIEHDTGRIELEPEDYFIIHDSNLYVTPENHDIIFSSPTDCLSMAINNWMAQMAASGTLITDGGPKGIIYNNDNSEFGNNKLTSKEIKKINDSFREKYGLVNKMYSILATNAKVGWLPINYNSAQLKLHEEDIRCSRAIYSALGLNYDMMSESKYDNQMSANKTAYQDIIIPDAIKISEALTNNLCGDNCSIVIDFSHIDCLQKDKKAMADTISVILNAMTGAVNDSILTPDEARMIISEYIDIDPDNAKGEYRGTNQKNNNNEQVQE